MTTRTHSSIVTKAATLAGLSAATLAMAAALAAAQVPDQTPPGGKFGPGGGGVQVKVGGPAIGTGRGPVPLIMLATQPPVQEELKLTDAQKQKIAKIEEQLNKEKDERARNLMAPKPDQGGGPQFLDPEMARAGMQETKQAIQDLHSEADAAVMRELQRKQRTRLEQIKLQVDGPLAFERPEVLERLNLGDSQIELIQGILDDGRGQMEQSGGFMMRAAGAMPGPGFGPGPSAGDGAGPGPGAGPGGAPPSPQDLKKKVASKEFQDQVKAQFEKRRKETQGVRDQMMQAIGKVLTRGQRASYRKMLGEPFDLKPLQNAAPKISVTTVEAPGAGAGAGDGSNAAEPKSDQPDPTPTASKNKAARPKRSR
jgi:Spy/CpxP family protein refolding chaperone